MSNVALYLKGHSSAILATVLVVAKAGLLGKVASAVVTAIAAAISAS